MTASPVVRCALISVSNKHDVVVFARRLVALGITIISTGGTARILREGDVDLREVSEVTGFPEIMDGRVKTLHPAIHGGILARRESAADRAILETHEISPIDLVVGNLYPFQGTEAAGAPFNECIEQIDIGGPTLIRAAAKNHEHVVVVTDPADYDGLLEELEANEGSTRPEFRSALAAKAYAHTAAYDGAIAHWFARQAGSFPDTFVIAGALKQRLRYGENPHQQAALYATGPAKAGICGAEQIQGKDLSYNNLADSQAAWELVNELDRPAVAIIKHANPCGVAERQTVADAHAAALQCDPVSAFGGIVASNRPIDRAAAEAITGVFTEVIIAPDIEAEAREVLAEKTNLRVLLTSNTAIPSAPQVKILSGGFLLQQLDLRRISARNLTVVSQRSPTDQELGDLLFAFTVCKHVKSNAIIYAKNGATVGIGAGQMSRVDSVRMAAWKATDAAHRAGEPEPRTRGSVVASDAYFPFSDGLVATIEAGATAVIQPGGSKRDREVIDAADEAGIAMVFTGVRHFRH